MAMNMKKVAPDPGHDTEYPGVVEYEDGRSARTDVDGGVYLAVAMTLKCE